MKLFEYILSVNKYKLKIDKLLKNNSLIKNAGILTSGTVAAQLISILSSPILTRLYTPEDFGVLNVFVSLLAILTVGSALRFEMAIPLPKENETASCLVILAITSVFFTSFLIFTIFNIFSFKNILWIDMSILREYFILLPIGLFFSGLYIVFNFWAIRIQQYKAIAKTKLYQAGSGVGLQILLGIIGIKPLGLLIGSILKQASGFISLSRIYWTTHNSAKLFSIKYLIIAARDYKKFPLVSSWSGIINILGLNLPVILIANEYGTTIAGFFGFSLMIISLPITLIGKSISQVFIGQASKLYSTKPDELKKLYQKISKMLFKVGVIPAIILSIWSSDLFSLIFGKSWYEAGSITQVLAAMFLIQFIVIPLSQLLTIIEKQGTQLFWDILRLALVVLSIIIPNILGYNYFYAISIYGLAMFTAYLSLLLIHLFTLNRMIKKNIYDK